VQLKQRNGKPKSAETKKRFKKMEETNANVNDRTKADSCRKPIRKRRIRRRRRSVGDRPRENCSGND